MRKIIGPALILVALIGALGLLFSLTDVRAPFSAPSQQSASMTTAHLNEDASTYAINAQYPRFGIAAVDEQIQKAVSDAADEIRSYPPNPPDSAVKQNTLDISFDSVYIGPDVISFELTFSQYTGGAHPMTILSGMNFDRATGRKLELSDALKLIGKSVADVSAEATKEFRQKFEDAFFAEGADTNPENYSSFLISADKVTFIFQAYQVAAYAAGPQQVSFPRK